MTKEEMYAEIEGCRQRMHKLKEEIDKETDLSVIIEKIKMMNAIRDEARELGNKIIDLTLSKFQ